MTLDVVFAGALLLLIFLGWRRGILRQAVRLGAAISVVVFASPLSGTLREIVFQDATVAAPLLEACSLLGAAIVIYVTVALTGWVVIKSLHGMSETLSTTDHLGGALLGAIKSMAMIYVLATSALWAGPWLESIDRADHMHLRDGETTAFVQEHDVLAPWKFPDVKRLHVAIKLANTTPIPYALLRSEPSASTLVRHERFRELARQKELQDAAMGSKFAVTLAHKEVRAFLNDQEMTTLLRQTNWERLGEMAAKKKRGEDD